MQMTYEQAMRPGILMAFAARRGSGYMMRSEKRTGPYSNGSNRRPPKRRAGFWYIFLTLLLCLILWPVGMVLLWRRKVRLQAGTKLLISLLTLCLSVFLIVFALTVPVDNPEFTAFQDRANDWLDQAATDVAKAGDAAYKKSTETWLILSDFSQAAKDYALQETADLVDRGVEIAGDARAAAENALHREDAPEAANTQTPDETPELTDAPEATEPADTPEATLETETAAPAATEAAPLEQTPEPAQAAEDGIDIRLPRQTPDAQAAQPLTAGTLHADGSFTPAEVSAPEGEAPSPEPEATPEAEPETWTAVEDVTEAPTAEPTPEPTEAPTQAPAEAPDEPSEAPAETDDQNGVMVLVEPTPEPAEAEAEPAPSGNVKPASQATVYYFESGSKGFHIAPNLHGMNGAPAHTLAEAFAAGKTPCRSCGMPDESILSEPNVAWVDENNLIHTTDECASFAGNWRLIPLSEAVEAGYASCPDCGADAYVEGLFPAPTATPAPEVVTPSTPLKSAGEITVYYFDISKGYHVAPSCKGMSNAPAHTLAEAVADGKHACGNCKPLSAELIGLPMLWLDEEGLCHTTDACSSFSGTYSLVSRDDALAQALPACPDCGATEYLIPGTVLAGE